ncbi:MAG: HNH endonuclease, partial [Acidimicrobiia bacterium]|nr:HNH endonuclease [Acidimicrobiia bacterium]
MSSAPASASNLAAVGDLADGVPFDFRARVDELRGRGSKAVRAFVAETRRHQQRWYLQELAGTLALDELEALDGQPDASVSARTAKTNREVARSLESLPKVTAAAWDGELSKDQLVPLTEVATPETDAEWAERGRRTAPVDLQRQARAARTVTAADAAARRAARYVTSWRDAEQGMVFGRWALPDVDGVLVEKVLDHMAERMRPAKGMRWGSLAHRKADALVDLCRNSADVGTAKRAKAVIVVHKNHGVPGGEVEGIPIAEERLQELLPHARVIEQDDAAPVIDYGDGRIAIPVALQRELERRDHHCRYPGCEHTLGLQNHHIDPVGWGGRTSRKLVVRLCPRHH